MNHTEYLKGLDDGTAKAQVELASLRQQLESAQERERELREAVQSIVRQNCRCKNCTTLRAALSRCEAQEEAKWDKAFAESHDVLEVMAEKALQEHREGKTIPLEQFLAEKEAQAGKGEQGDG